MKMPFVKFTSLALIWLAIYWQAAQAQNTSPQAMISNLNQLWTGGDMGNFETVTPSSGFGFMFETGATPYTLDTVTFELIVGNLATLDVQLYSVQGSLGSPNPNLALVGLLGNPVFDSRPTQWPSYTSFIDFSPINSITLAPNTYYLIGVTEPVNGDDSNALTFNFNYSYTVSDDWSLPAAYTFWHYSTSRLHPYGWFPSAAGGSMMLEVDATPVPEPAASILLLLACVFFGVAAPHRR
jgi:hypothetical protein